MPKRKGYRRWLEDVAAMRGWDANEMANDPTYDYRVFYYKEPALATGILHDSPNAHFSDIGKTSEHPTFSNESIYSGRKSIRNPRGIVGGTWSPTGNRYTLSQSQIDNNWNIPRTIEYLSDAEDNGVQLRMPNGDMPIVNGIRFGGVLPAVTVVGKNKKKKEYGGRTKAKDGFWDKVDKYAEYAETATALSSLAAGGATLVAPNPVTGAIAVGSNIAGAGIDLYQGIRSAINGDWGSAAKNGAELLLSLIGAKAMSSANKLSKIDKALDAAGTTRKTVTRTIGRGRGRHSIKLPVERSKAHTLYSVGFGASTGGNASSFGGNLRGDTTAEAVRNQYYANRYFLQK